MALKGVTVKNKVADNKKLASDFDFSRLRFGVSLFSGIVCHPLYRGPCSWACIVLPDRPLCSQTETGRRGWPAASHSYTGCQPPATTHTQAELRRPGCECRPWMVQNHSSPTGAQLHRPYPDTHSTEYCNCTDKVLHVAK